MDDTNLFLNNMVSEDDRKTLICTKADFMTHHCSIFQDMMPNLLRYLVLKIKMIYGPSFENKKGFIIDGL
jgi:hypothetical protein